MNGDTLKRTISSCFVVVENSSCDIMIWSNLHFSFIFVIFFLLVLSYGKIPTFSAKEKAAIDKLRVSVEHKLVLTYMKSDAYLYKWLKAKKFDHIQALQALEKALAWRKEANIDNLPSEDNGKLAKDFVLDFTTARDKEGLPVCLGAFGDWDIRRKALEGKVSEVSRRVLLLEEKGAQLAFNETGDPTAILIADAQGLSLRKHVCVACIPVYLKWVVHHENYYTYNYYRLLIINTPSFFDPVVRLMRPLMTESTRIVFRIFGYDRAEYSAFIAETVDLSVLPFRFGGTKKSGKH